MGYKLMCPHDKRWRHCSECGLGIGEWMACEEPECGALECATCARMREEHAKHNVGTTSKYESDLDE